MAKRNMFDCISISSYYKKKLAFVVNQLVSDTTKLRNLIHKIIHLRALVHKSTLLFSLVTYRRSFHINSFHSEMFAFLSRLCAFSDVVGFSALTRLHYAYVGLKAIACDLFGMYLNYVYTYSLYIRISLSLHRYSIGAASMPTHISKFTVLRAPQIDKRAREQFEIRTYKRAYSYMHELAPFYRYLYLSRRNASTCSMAFSLHSFKYDCF
jgi:hypothetical protein